MTTDQTGTILAMLLDGQTPAIETLASLEQPDVVFAAARDSPVGRRWLRSLVDLPEWLAESLLGYEDDFRTQRRDRTLAAVVNRASVDALIAHAAALVQGAAAPAFWQRVAGEGRDIVHVAEALVSGDDPAAAESTLYLLLMDPLDPYGIGTQGRTNIARTALASPAPQVRTLAAEYLYDNDINELADHYQTLVRDEDERVRGLGWSAGIQADTTDAINLANDILNNEQEPTTMRRSALAALGTSLETADVIDLLTYFVVYPDADLALDAANLLYRLHRHPTIAMAAVQSPHADVRDIGQFLLDPYRGSPAAGGSRPGDPTRSDIFAQLIRETEDRAGFGNDSERGQNS